MLRPSVLVLSLLLTVAAATAVEIVHLGPIDVWPEIDPSTFADGVVGRPVQPGYVVPWETPLGMVVATTFDPRVYDLPCDSGIIVRAIHVVIAKTETDDPYPLVPSPAIASGFPRDAYPRDARCFEPPTIHPGYECEACAAVPDHIMLEGPAGFYELVYSDFAEGCDCIDMRLTQRLEFVPPQGVFTRLVTDVAPGHCPDHRLVPWFQGIAHWHELDAPGNLVVWAEVDCCDAPVAIERPTWSTVKGLFDGR